MLAQAAETVNRAAEKAAAELARATDEAIATVQKSAEEATTSITHAIDDANEKLFEVTRRALMEMVGDDEASVFDLAPLRKRWSNTG